MMNTKQSFKKSFGAVRAHRAAAEALLAKTNIGTSGEADISTYDAYINAGCACEMLPAAIMVVHGMRQDPLLTTLADRADVYEYN